MFFNQKKFSKIRIPGFKYMQKGISCIALVLALVYSKAINLLFMFTEQIQMAKLILMKLYKCDPFVLGKVWTGSSWKVGSARPTTARVCLLMRQFIYPKILDLSKCKTIF